MSYPPPLARPSPFVEKKSGVEGHFDLTARGETYSLAVKKSNWARVG